MADELPKSENVVANAGIVEWQRGLSLAVNETYNYANSSLFLGVMPAYYRDYAWRYLRPAIQWLDGYVPALHQGGFSGIMSTRIATKLITGLTKQVVGEKLLLKPNDKKFDEEARNALRFASKWYEENNIIKAVYAGIGFSLGLGTSLLKMNKTIDNKIWWEASRFDQCFYLADFRNEIKEATFLIRGYTDTRKEHSNCQFYLVEKRYWKVYTVKDKLMEKAPDGSVKVLHKIGDREPTVVYQVYRVNGTTMNNTMPAIAEGGSLNWDNIPADIRKMIKENYSAIRINEPQPLGFINLGVAALLNGNIDLSVPTGTNFGESMLVGIQDDLITYEVARAYLLRDMYLGKGTVYVPKSLNISDVDGMNGLNPDSVLTGIGEGKVETIKGLSPEEQKIVVQQFDTRVAEWQTAMENALKMIAVKWSMSPKILASFLANGQTQMTATQVDSEDDLSIAFVNHTRAYFKNAINKLLETTMNFYGIASNITFEFASPSLVNKDRLINRVTNELQAGLIDIEDAIRTVYPDLDEEALQSKIDKAKAQQEQMMMQSMTEMTPEGEMTGENLDGTGIV